MSAFIVSDEHIGYLVNAGLRLDTGGKLRWYWGNPTHSSEVRSDNVDAVGQMLVNANFESVNARYRKDDPPHEYKHEWDRRQPDPVQVLKAISCFDYQSCESPSWEASEAKAFCHALQCLAISKLPGYDKAEWEIGRAKPLEV